MKKNTIKQLIKYLQNDDNFYYIYKQSLQNELDKSKSIVFNALYRSFKKENEKQFKNHYNLTIKDFIQGMEYEDIMDFYLLDKRYLDIAWLHLNNDLINLDNLYVDFKSYCQG